MLFTTNLVYYFRGSPSTRRAWIEMNFVYEQESVQCVALHPEGVDRNSRVRAASSQPKVALHPEGVDRNKN